MSAAKERDDLEKKPEAEMKQKTKEDSSPDCLFCQIGSGNIKSTFVYEDAASFAIADITPQAPTHILVVPKKHYQNIALVDDQALMGGLFQTAALVAAQAKLSNGFRLVVNSGDDGGQSVGHLHIHVLGGRQMLWPPG